MSALPRTRCFLAAAAWASLTLPASGSHLCASDGVSHDGSELFATQDVLLLARGCPLLIRIQCHFDAAEVTRSRRTLAEVLVNLLDANRDGTLDADEARKIPAYGLFGDQRRVADEWPRLDRAPRDQTVSPDEVAAHTAAATHTTLALEAGVSVRSLALDLQQRLDENGDGLIVPEELRHAADALRACDLDDDGTFSLVELEALSEAARAEAETRNPAARFVPFVQLDPTLSDAIISLLMTWYSVAPSDSVTTAGTSPAGRVPFDEDSDGAVTEDEVRHFLHLAEPDYRLDVRFGARFRNIIEWSTAAPNGDAAQVPQFLPRLGRRNGLQVSAAGSDINLDWQNLKLVVSLQQQQIQGQFAVADGNRNKYIEASEFAGLDLPGREFADVDFDLNGEIVRPEFDAFIEQELYFSEFQLAATVDNERRSLFTALDGDKDRRLTPRELLGEMAGEPGSVENSVANAAEQLGLTFRQGIARLSSDPVLPTGETGRRRSAKPVVTARTEGPLWFRKMDRNQDGDVNWREFLGPVETFARLDANGDTLIDADEAAAATP
jgi:hypothetical protein